MDRSSQPSKQASREARRQPGAKQVATAVPENGRNPLQCYILTTWPRSIYAGEHVPSPTPHTHGHILSRALIPIVLFFFWCFDPETMFINDNICRFPFSLFFLLFVKVQIMMDSLEERGSKLLLMQ